MEQHTPFLNLSFSDYVQISTKYIVTVVPFEIADIPNQIDFYLHVQTRDHFYFLSHWYNYIPNLFLNFKSDSMND